MAKKKNKPRTPKEIKSEFKEDVKELKNDFEEEKKKNLAFKKVAFVLKDGHNASLRILLSIFDFFLVLYMFYLVFWTIPICCNYFGNEMNITASSSPAQCVVFLLVCLFCLEIAMFIAFKLTMILFGRIKYRFRKRSDDQKETKKA
jgi:hypothetical protein